MDSERLDHLIDAYVLGEARDAERAELTQALHADAAARHRFVERAMMEAHLYRASSPQESVERVLRMAKSQPSWRGGARWLSAAAALVLAAGVAVALYLGLARPSGLPGGPQVVQGRILIDGQAVRRVDEDRPVRVVGQEAAVLILADGSRVVLDPDSEAIFTHRPGEARQVVRLASGGGRFTVAHAGGAFRVETPAGRVTALGTEFAARLLDRGQPALAVGVDAGSVRVDVNGRSRVLAAGQSCLVRGKEIDPGRGRTLRARVLAVDPRMRSVTARFGDEPPRTLTFFVAPDADIRVDDRPASPEDLPTGRPVLLHLDAAGEKIVGAEAAGRTMAGTVRSVDAAAGTLTLTVGERGGEGEEGEGRRDVVFPVVPWATVTVGGRPGSLEQVRPGERPLVRLTVDGTSIVQVRTGYDREEGEGETRRRPRDDREDDEDRPRRSGRDEDEHGGDG